MQNVRNYTNTTSAQNYTQGYSRPQNYSQGSPVQYTTTQAQNYNQGLPAGYTTTQAQNYSQGSTVQYTNNIQNPIISQNATTTFQPAQNISTSYQYMPDPYPINQPSIKYQ